MEIKQQDGLTVVSLSERNLAELSERPSAGSFPSLTKRTESGILIVQVEPDEAHYSKLSDRSRWLYEAGIGGEMKEHH